MNSPRKRMLSCLQFTSVQFFPETMRQTPPLLSQHTNIDSCIKLLLCVVHCAHISHLILEVRLLTPFCRYADRPKVTQLGHWRSRIQAQVSIDSKVLVFNQDFRNLPLCQLEILFCKPSGSILTRPAKMFITFDIEDSF